MAEQKILDVAARVDALREEHSYITSVDGCCFCGDCECDGVGCIASIDPDAAGAGGPGDPVEDELLVVERNLIDVELGLDVVHQRAIVLDVLKRLIVRMLLVPGLHVGLGGSRMNSRIRERAHDDVVHELRHILKHLRIEVAILHHLLSVRSLTRGESLLDDGHEGVRDGLRLHEDLHTSGVTHCDHRAGGKFESTADAVLEVADLRDASLFGLLDCLT